jgi:hypothetical protein
MFILIMKLEKIYGHNVVVVMRLQLFGHNFFVVDQVVTILWALYP